MFSFQSTFFIGLLTIFGGALAKFEVLFYFSFNFKYTIASDFCKLGCGVNLFYVISGVYEKINLQYLSECITFVMEVQDLGFGEQFLVCIYERALLVIFRANVFFKLFIHLNNFAG